MSHLTEEQLNLYLDNELPPGERAVVEAHLAGCEACRIELVSMQTLFTALDTLQLENLAADLAPLVLDDIATERQRAIRRRRIGWLAPGLQGVAAILLLLFGWSALAMRYDELARQIPAETLYAAWANTLARSSIFWTATITHWQTWWRETITGLLDLPAVLGQTTPQWPQFSGLGLTTPQITTISLVAVLMWLAGNSILLRKVAGTNSSHRPNH
jgi:predicted anti-sigma-YlaC factor YlaD